MRYLTIYIIIGVLFTLFVDRLTMNTEEELTNKERIRGIITWPLTLYYLIKNILKHF